ncbi:hypothetical protein AB205_0044170 [Aquarana catesbeiana]|uniref:PEHE domain-containing protein n=1 Tax=Aquarana catesbeiana TaxID=8400 RepID=A0A2G9SAS1_AQUCT|nr:hypothetical protein AB205_0044170 [Aquarana catesbeiana]
MSLLDVPAGLRFHALLRSHNKMDRLKSSKKLKQRSSNSVSTTEIPRTDRTLGVLHTHKLTLHRPFPELSSKQHLDPLQRTLKCDRSQALKPERSLIVPLPHQKKRQFSPIDRDGRHEVDTAGPSLAADIGPSPSHTPLSRQLSTPSDSSSLSAAAAAARKRRLETSYDIDNIVIPMSVAATTRVERLQYKEILTPSWRVVKITPLTPNSEKDIDELEDLSDSSFAALHAKCEETERARWVSTSLPPQRRGSRTHRTSEGSMTPQSFSMQPPSPDTSSWQAVSDFSPLSPDVLSAPPTPTSRDTPRLISEETQSSVSDSGYEETKLREPANLQTGEVRALRADFPAAPELPKTQRDPLPLRPALPPDRGPSTDKEQWRVKNLQRKKKKIYINIYKSDKTIWLQKNPLFDIQTLSPEQSASFTVFSEFKNFRDLLPSPRYLCFFFMVFHVSNVCSLFISPRMTMLDMPNADYLKDNQRLLFNYDVVTGYKKN